MKTYRAFVKYEGELESVYLSAETIESALKIAQADPRISEVLSISEESNGRILTAPTEVKINRV